MSARRRVAKRTLIGGTAAAGALIGTGAISDYGTLAPTFTNLDDSAEEVLDIFPLSDQVNDDLGDLIAFMALTYLPAAGIFSVAELVRDAKKEVSKRRQIRNRINEIRPFTRNRISGQDVIDVAEVNRIKSPATITGAEFKRWNAGKKRVFLQRVQGIPNKSIEAVLTGPEKRFADRIATGTTLRQIKKDEKKALAAEKQRQRMLRKKRDEIRAITYKSTRPKGPKQLTMGTPGKYPLAKRPQGIGTLFNKILGTPEARRKASIKEKADKWWDSLTAKERKKHLRRQARKKIFRRIKKF